MQWQSSSDQLRPRVTAEDGRVSFVELFFDLVFVFAITQLSHTLLHHFSLAGALQTGLLLLAVWWAWLYTAWVTNWLDPRRTPVRLLLFALMLAGLVISMSIPSAFGAGGLAFALAYAVTQIGRSLFMLWALAGRSAANFRNFRRITCWLSLAGVLWVAGGLASGETRIGLWLVGLAIEYAGPIARFWTPFLGRSATTDWDVAGAHLAERCGLFVIICLGKSILVTRATFAQIAWTPTTSAAFLAAFVTAVAMWWIYFNIGYERASHVIEKSGDPGGLPATASTTLISRSLPGSSSPRCRTRCCWRIPPALSRRRRPSP